MFHENESETSYEMTDFQGIPQPPDFVAADELCEAAFGDVVVVKPEHSINLTHRGV